MLKRSNDMLHTLFFGIDKVDVLGNHAIRSGQVGTTHVFRWLAAKKSASRYIAHAMSDVWRLFFGC